MRTVPDQAALDAPPGTGGCPVCGAGGATVWKRRGIDWALRPEDLRITDHRYGVTLTLLRCPTCGFIFADPIEARNLTSLYEDLEDPEYETGQSTRALQMEWLLNGALRARPAARTVLDIGAGAGLLVSRARKRGLDAVGVEPSRSLSARAPEVNAVEVLQGVYPHPALSGRQFDLVFLVDVIEHVADPVALLRAAASGMAPAGAMIVVTPDVASLAARMLKGRWWHFRLAHVGYFTSRTMETAAEQAGLIVERKFRARWFFPASYLVERLGEYAPTGWILSLARHVGPLRGLLSLTVRLNLNDSWVFILREKGTIK